MHVDHALVSLTQHHHYMYQLVAEPCSEILFFCRTGGRGGGGCWKSPCSCDDTGCVILALGWIRSWSLVVEDFRRGDDWLPNLRLPIGWGRLMSDDMGRGSRSPSQRQRDAMRRLFLK